MKEQTVADEPTEDRTPLGVVKTNELWKDMTDEEIDALSKKLFIR